MYFAIPMLITIPIKVLNGNFHTVRPVGRPRTRWTDVVQRDARQLLRIRGWRSKAANRDEWRRLMREAKARKGLLRRRWMEGWMFIKNYNVGNTGILLCILHHHGNVRTEICDVKETVERKREALEIGHRLHWHSERMKVQYLCLR
jgi:hypothetical protein